MTYTSATRDRYRLAVVTTTAAVAAGAVTATGWVAGAVAREQARADAADQAAQAAQAQREHDAWVAAYGEQETGGRARPVVRQRPTRTRVTVRYVAAAGTASVGGGGTIGTAPPAPTTPAPSTTPPTAPQGPAGGAGPGGGTSAPQPAPPPPPPPPPPAPSSGS